MPLRVKIRMYVVPNCCQRPSRLILCIVAVYFGNTVACVVTLYIDYHYYFYTGVMVNFSQPAYSVEENSGVAEIQLMFSNPSSIDITVQVYSGDINATG